MSYGALAEAIRGLARRAGEQEAPVGFAFGQVVSEEPLEIRVEQRLLLPEEVLVLTDGVIGSARLVAQEGEGETENRDPIYIVEHNLHKYDRVLLARVQGGRAYVILSRYYATEKEDEKK